MEDANAPSFELQNTSASTRAVRKIGMHSWRGRMKLQRLRCELIANARSTRTNDRKSFVRSVPLKTRKASEAVEDEARRKLELEEKRSRDREVKRAAEDACMRATRPLGMDRHLSTYWWNFGGRKDAIYVQSFSGEWGLYNSQEAVDKLFELFREGCQRTRPEETVGKAQGDDRRCLQTSG